MADELPRMETCEIEYRIVAEGPRWTTGYFRAKAMGEAGEYTAGQSGQFVCRDSPCTPNLEDKDAVDVHNELVSFLLSDGWELTAGHGSEWWGQRFERNTSKPRKERCEIRTQSYVELFRSPTARFVAIAVGPRGEYKAGESAVFKNLPLAEEGKNRPEIRVALAKLEQDLLRDGWECESVGEAWFRKSYVREVR